MVSVFLIIGAVGAGLLLVAVVIGDLFDGLFDFGDVGGDFFSLAGLAGFIGALGFTGAIVLSLAASLVLALIVGAVVGLGVGALAAWLTMRLRDPSRDSDSTVRSHHLIGAVGRVIHPIPEGGFGQIRVSVHGHPTMLNARADEPIAGGRLIQITEVLTPTSVKVRHGEPLEP
ncbi:MAG TPA: hypothetical protein GXZ30_13050 [Propionibacterium sp.]|jgi:membrane protein implicated in regulation of membrane protease activity|nr:hypothetical protein [Propionibacterium sp.]